MEIIKDFVSSRKYKLKCPYSMVPEFIVIHNTANDASAKNEVSYMKNSASETSFHFAVDDAEVRQAIPLDRNAWHAGDGNTGNGNRCGIAIEICYSKSGGNRFLKAEENAAQFTAMLLLERGWGINRVKKHQDFSGKYCPHKTLDLGWERFLKMVESYMNPELISANDIIWQLQNGPLKVEINQPGKAVRELEKAQAENNSLYWILRKIVNN